MNRRLNRSAVRHLSRVLNGRRRARGHSLSQALKAFSRAIKAHKRLIKLVPELFDPVVIEKEARRREQDEKWRQIWEPALRQVYGDKSADLNSRPIDTSQSDALLPKSPRTRAAVQRAHEDCKLWLGIGSTALGEFRRRRPHYVPAFSQIVRMFEIAFTLKRLACGLPLEGTLIPPELDQPPEFDPLRLLERIYGNNADH